MQAVRRAVGSRNFVGVGYGSSVKPRVLDAGRTVTHRLLTAAGARMTDWNVALAPDET